MEHRILYKPDFSIVELNMEAGEEVRAETGAMVYMSPKIEIKTEMRGGLMKSLKRKALGGESLFITTFKANEKGIIGLTAAYMGDIIVHEMQGEDYYVQSGSYLASTLDVEIDTKYAGSKGFFAREGLFLLKATGTGQLFISSFGAIHRINLKDESFIVDTGFMVAFENGLDYNIRKVGGLKSTLLSGEGFVADFHGTGELLIQTRSTDRFIGWTAKHLGRPH